MSTPPVRDSYVMAMAIFSVLLIFLALTISQSQQGQQGQQERLEYLSYHEGRLDAQDKAWQQGRRQGYLETEALAEYENLINQTEAYNKGWREGYNSPWHYYYGY